MTRIALLLGFIAVLAALAVFLLTQARLGAALACDRSSGLCLLTQRQLTSSWIGRLPIATVDRAEVRTRPGRGSSPQVWLVTQGGDYFFATYVLRPSADDVAQQINAFLRTSSPDARLFVREDERLAYWLGGAVIPLDVALCVWLGLALFRKPTSPRAGRDAA